MGQNHPIEQEELMAYLDGELPTDRAAAAVAHLDRCSECESLAADLRDVSQNLMAWEVAASSPRIEPAIASALEERGRERASSTPASGQPWRNVFRMRRFAPWASGLAVVCFLFVVGLTVKNNRSRRTFQSVASSVAVGEPMAGGERQNGGDHDRLGQFAKLQAPPASPPAADSKGLFHGLGQRARNSFSVDGQSVPEQGSVVHHLPAATLEAGESAVARPNGPMIVRTAAVTLTTKDFDKARAGLDDILKRHHGYVGELNVNTPLGVGRTLTATLRVPADQLEATLADLRKLGRVEAESQSGQEVTAQYVDLEARRGNARNTERRLTELLEQRTGKLPDVLAVETELSRVRGEIESMEAERKNLANQVDFATLNVTVNEDYKARLQVMPPSTATQFRNAAVDGYRTMVDGIVGVAVFLVSYGPSLLFWAAVLFLPARTLWRKVRPSHR
jgi:Domain of unknown function (DUF4349)/Putative zinc-finger